MQCNHYTTDELHNCKIVPTGIQYPINRISLDESGANINHFDVYLNSNKYLS